MTYRKALIPDEIADLLRELSENESDGGELSCSKLDSDEDITLSESDCEESEKVQRKCHGKCVLGFCEEQYFEEMEYY
ncbi:hypothetical protein TNCV_111421 [Trichonephila clavipes]|nr:hypothetical protein TNCV_111421 [Trichonephila clavipes]